jgi:organic radical activating enzyme
VVHQYKNNGYNIVLDVNSGAIHVVDDVTYDVIELFEDNSAKEIIEKLVDRYPQTEIEEAIQEVNELKDNEELFTEDTYKERIIDFKKRQTVVKALCLHIAHDCNLACRYCFAEEGEYHGRRALMSYETGKQALDFLIANSGSRRNLEVDFFGGEPLMNWDVVKQLVAYGREQEKLHDKHFRFTLTTNGVLLNDEIMEFANKEMDNVVLSTDKMALQRLKEAAEKAKKELSSATTTNINLPFITATAEGPKHFDMTLTRAKFDELTHDLVERTAIPVQNAMKDAGVTNADLGQVLLVGGSTRIPAVQDKVKQMTGKEPSKSLNPDECVAIGASIQGGKLAGDAGAGEVLLLDVTPLSLSIETMGGVATRLIERNTTIPTRKSQIFSTAADNQTAVDINVVQGERQFARDNKSLGQFRLDGIPPARRGVPQIEVTFDIDANGIVNVSAKDLGTGKEQHITITAGSNMSDDEIDKAVKEAAEFEAQDKKRKEAIDARNDAESFVFQTEDALKQVGDSVDAADKSAVEADIAAVKSFLDAHKEAEAMTEADVAELKAAQEKLTQSAQKVFAKMYEQAQAAQGAAGAGPDMNAGAGQAGPDMNAGASNGADDDVIDADFKEV